MHPTTTRFPARLEEPTPCRFRGVSAAFGGLVIDERSCLPWPPSFKTTRLPQSELAGVEHELVFPQIGKIPFEGRESRNPLAFKHYDAERVVGAKSMKDHLRFAVAYWHTFKATGADPFGAAVFARPWNASADPLERARHTLESAFEFIAKLGVPYYCFHDFDIAPEGTTFAESERNLKATVALALEQQQRTGIKLLWGTANLFSHPRYVHGAMTSPDPHVFACAAMQVKRALDATRELGGENYVFWGGREGYETILNTDMRREREQMARFLHMAVEYAKAIGFTDSSSSNPSPRSPPSTSTTSTRPRC